MQHSTHGVITHENSIRKADYLYRVSLKGLVRNDKGEVLVVKETGRDWWDLPGGGMDHDEDIALALAREMKEEVNLEGEFGYKILTVEDPIYLNELSGSDVPKGLWQIRLIYEVFPENMVFSAGEDGDETRFINPDTLKDSDREAERRIYQYVQLAEAAAL